jgi:drug/metabolite transporter (DMT)-like permease
MLAQKAPSSNNAVKGSTRTSSFSKRRRQEGHALSFSSSFRATNNAKRTSSKPRLFLENALKVYSGEASFSGVSRDDGNDEGRRRREKAIWRRGVKKNAGSSLCVPPLRAANKENGQNDFERATISAKNKSQAFSSADFGEECVGVGMNVECEIPIAECDDDDDKSRVVSPVPVQFNKGEEGENRFVANSTVEKRKKKRTMMAKGGVDSTSRDESCVGVGIDAECPIEEEEEEELLLLSSTTREVEVEEGVVAAATAKSGKQKQEFPALFYVAPFFLWGTSMVSMKEVLPLTSPMFVATVRLIPAGLILILWAVSKNRKFPKNAKGWLAVSLFALVDGAMFQGCLAEGLAKTSAGLGSVIIDSQPLTVAILASIFFGETLGAAGIGGLALGVVGLSLLEIPSETLAGFMSKSSSGGGADGGSASTFLQSFAAHPFDSGEFWMLLAAQSMAVGTVMVRWVVKYVDPVMATGLHMFLGGIPLLIYSLVSERDVYENIFGDGGGALGIADGANLLYASVFGGALAYSLFFYFASSGNLTKLSSLTFLTPVFAVVGGYFALGETLDAQQLVGAAVTLGGIYLVNKNAGGNDGS